MKDIICVAIGLGISLASYGQLLKYEVTKSHKHEFSLKQACTDLGTKHLVLVQAMDANRIDCMGKILQAFDYCLNFKKMTKQAGFLRGYVDKKQEKVICQTGDQVLLSYFCQENSSLEYCTSSGRGCQHFKEQLAYNLDLDHHTLLDADEETVKAQKDLKQGKILNCYYSKKIPPPK